MSGRFWTGLFGVVILGGIAAFVLFLLLGWALTSWGVIGALVFIFGVALLVGYVLDRREQRRYVTGE
jgi:uncharacterized membrane protein